MTGNLNMLGALTDNIIVDREKCIACGICAERCPMDNLRVTLAPCRQQCPLGVNAQGYVRLIATGQEEKALALVREALPFPGILGRVCSQPCEEGCHHTTVGSPALSIRALKRYLADRFAATPAPLPAMAPESGKRVAIIGAGPAGLMAAYELRTRGHGAVLHDAAPEPGGMLRWAIPAFRLPTDILKKELDLLRRMGALFECGRTIDTDGIAGMIKLFDAVIVATGCPSHKTLGIRGEDLPGVHYALPFLRSARGENAPTVGNETVVIGGGNAAVDAAQTALRLGAARVTLVCLEPADRMPAFPWAVEGMRAEGITVVNSLGPARFLERGGRLAGVEFVSCTRVFDDSGRFCPVFDACYTKVIDADTAIVAAGQEADAAFLSGSGIAEGGRMLLDPLTLQSRERKLFCAGDAANGPSSVVAAMASGRSAAVSTDRFLRGDDLHYGRTDPGPFETDHEIITGTEIDRKRMVTHLAPPAGKGDFREMELCPSEADAREEAGRCLSCGQAFGCFRTCWFCLPCEIECPHEALRVEIPYLLR